MKKSNYAAADLFIQALDSRPVESQRIYAERPDGNIGVTAWYVNQESIDAIKAEIIAAGHKIVRIEKKLI